MRKFTKEISALLASTAVGAAVYAGMVSASSEQIEQIEGVMANPDEIVENLPPEAGEMLPDEWIESTTEEEIPPLAGDIAPADDLIEPTTEEDFPPTVGVPMLPDEWIESTTEEEIPPLAGDIAPADGDINGDGDFSVSDVVILQRWLLTVPDTQLVNWKAADFYEDGKLNVFDLVFMKKALIERLDDTPVINEPVYYGFHSYDAYIKYIEDNNLQDKIVTYKQISDFGKFVQCNINDWKYDHYFSLFYVLEDGSGKTFDIIVNDLDHKLQDDCEYRKLTDEQVNLSDMRTVETDAQDAYFEIDHKRYEYYKGKLYTILWLDNEHEYRLIGNPQLSDYPYVSDTYLSKLLDLNY